MASLDKACGEFVNRNAVCKKSSSKSPELLARYCDSLLKKNAKNAEESELEDLLNSIVSWFTLLFTYGADDTDIDLVDDCI